MTTILGIDESGRGPVIGPLVIVGLMIDEDSEKELIKINVKDSKMLTPKQREALYEKIVKIAKDYKIMIITPNEIDLAVHGEDGDNLNWLEAQRSADLINDLRPDKVILDCPSPNKKAYVDYIKERLEIEPEIVAEHKADAKYLVVSAASIIAKVTRDKEIQRIKDEFDVDFGSGYPADPKTKKFIEENYNKYPFFRKSWYTYKQAVKKQHQRSLDKF